ncbi:MULTISPECIES: YraN family protein [Acidiphilium]|uniref:UPF0102 protein Acry_2261 n=2 Tax=Acidiphilium TaxID=522 RepID=Y2261_ACICJ|nr:MULTISPECIES: YraN family protein [Acidiphilium]A5G0S4.1 RecName: Full=UPF0102 protein Acry_2261 [Acidiphilium cryptum JF-5]ABQ31456.1 protein of unknown function UPF0102 [Acidiphilium cryptum JF-5]UNC13828.1 YraN family protein [Acidiphilium multivorum]BAJ81862.1 hypothetical protein ACMV_25150 [Acidiphilium multivorum AIU301]
MRNESERRAAARRRAEHRGRDAERRVAGWYAAQGFVVLAQRLRTAAGELDLVVADRTTLVFVEVKARNALRSAIESVAPRQRRRLVAAAAIVLAGQPDWGRAETRFDVVLLVGDDVHAIRDAFRADDP